MSQFCQHMERRMRCVLRRDHVEHGQPHELQPMSSVSVRAIVRQETDDERLAGTPGRVVRAINKAEEERSTYPGQPGLTAQIESESVPAPASTAETTPRSTPEDSTSVEPATGSASPTTMRSSEVRESD